MYLLPSCFTFIYQTAHHPGGFIESQLSFPFSIHIKCHTCASLFHLMSTGWWVMTIKNYRRLLACSVFSNPHLHGYVRSTKYSKQILDYESSQQAWSQGLKNYRQTEGSTKRTGELEWGWSIWSRWHPKLFQAGWVLETVKTAIYKPFPDQASRGNKLINKSPLLCWPVVAFVSTVCESIVVCSPQHLCDSNPEVTWVIAEKSNAHRFLPYDLEC